MSRRRESVERLLASGLCSGGDAESHILELRRLAAASAEAGAARRRARVLKALGDENRQRILGLLGVREMCVCELIAALEMTQPTTSHHLRILEEAGFVGSRREGKWVFYSLRDAGVLGRISGLVP